MKKFILLFLLFLFVGFGNVYAKEKVKVYVFEAGGCPYCEKQIEYLKGLDSYGKKFEIVEKELYVDHVNWELGKDYALGQMVADAFYNAGFENASYQGTPFVVISDIYAVTSYSADLESVINEAYKQGDKDVVGCYSKGKSNCLDFDKLKNKDEEPVKENNNTDTYTIGETSSESEKGGSNLVIILLVVFLSLSVIMNIVFIIVLATKKNNQFN